MSSTDYGFTILIFVQAFHLLHHRLAKRHISFAEVVSGFLLCLYSFHSFHGWVLTSAYCLMVAVQVVGSIFIKRLSPDR